MINPLITLAVFPVLYCQIKRSLRYQENSRLLLLLVLAGTIIGEMIFPASLATWYDVPVIVMTCILTADLFLCGRKDHRGPLVYLYLTLVATWLLFATAIVFIRIAYYRNFSDIRITHFDAFNALRAQMLRLKQAKATEYA
jgi:hypothetical protein